MQINCDKCQTIIEFEPDSVPKFCSECGVPISSLLERTTGHCGSTLEEETLTRAPDSKSSQSQNSDLLESRPALDNERVGPYRLVRKLGQGGMGSVFEATHEHTQQSVALKLLMPSLRKTDESVQRFKRESQIAASINHPRSTFVYEAGEHGDQFYITMELMDGGTLKDIIADEGPLSVARAVDYVLDIIDGLRVAHAAGIVHRDLKPSNCFIDHDGRVKIGDFGLAKSFLGDSDLTQTGTFMGTPQYAAPEQLRASEVDERADIYALGATLFYLLAGRSPFQGNPAQVIASIASETPPKVSEFADSVPRELVRLIAQTMEKSPAKRPQQLAILRDALLPYSSRGASLADIGRRMAAFFIDFVMANLIIVISSQMAGIMMVVAGGFNGQAAFNDIQLLSTLISVLFCIAYFAVPESTWGRSLGKWLMGMRVIGKNQEPPGLFAATIRAFLVPGLMVASSSITMSYLIKEPPSTVRATIDLMIEVQIVWLLSWIPSLLCMIVARKSNGYQGVHGLLTSTRVARLSGDLEARRIDTTTVTVPATISEPRPFGQYQAIGQFTPPDVVPVALLGDDPALDRDVWIFDEVPTGELSEQRRHITRPNRLRILMESRKGEGRNGSDGDERGWLVTDAVKGIPLIDALKAKENTWEMVRPLFDELANELQHSLKQSMLPNHFNADLVWVDEMGRIKILDFPVTAGEAKTVPQDDSPLQQANQTFHELLSLYIQHHNPPVHIVKFQEEMGGMMDDEYMLEWAGNRLTDFADKPSRWNWDDRLGVIAISWGFELGLLTTVVYLTGFLCVIGKASDQAVASLTMTTGIVLLFLLGYICRGGVAFRLAEIAVLRNSKPELAGPIRCGLRNVIAWSPALVLGTSLVYFISMQLKDAFNEMEIESLYLMFGLLIASVPAALLLVAGFAAALVFPARGMQDLIVGTRLARR